MEKSSTVTDRIGAAHSIPMMEKIWTYDSPKSDDRYHRLDRGQGRGGALLRYMHGLGGLKQAHNTKFYCECCTPYLAYSSAASSCGLDLRSPQPTGSWQARGRRQTCRTARLHIEITVDNGVLHTYTTDTTDCLPLGTYTAHNCPCRNALMSAGVHAAVRRLAANGVPSPAACPHLGYLVHVLFPTTAGAAGLVPASCIV